MKRLAFTLTNERLLRQHLFDDWQVYYASRRASTLRQLKSLDPKCRVARELRATRYYQAPAPFDLSGACKISAQVALQVFKLDGRVCSNARHTFVVLNNGQVYDLNRHCRDANVMAVQQLDPYEINWAYSDDPHTAARRATWQRFIAEFMTGFATWVETRPGIAKHTGPAVGQLTGWGQPRAVPHTRFKQWQIGIEEISDDNKE